MPELPEVEYGRKLCEQVGRGRSIVKARCEPDDIVYTGTTPQRVARALKGRTIEAVHRHGKYLWWELDTRPWPVFHFGMTGAFRARDVVPIALARGPRADDTQWPPRFSKILVELDDGAQLAMTNARRLGRIRLAKDPRAEPPLSRLGFDPLTQMPSPADFARHLRRRKGVLKGLLLDQTFAAGVGNWIADEVLYQARLDPRRTADSLDDREVKALHRKLRSVVSKAVSVDADKSRFPRTWLFHRRWGKQNDQRIGGHPIEHLEIGGRTTAWVPAVQR